MLGALLFGGIGTLIYIAIGERGNHVAAVPQQQAATAGDASALVQPPPPQNPPPVVAPDAAVAPIVGSNGSNGSGGSNAIVDDTQKHPKPGDKPKHPPVQITDDKNPQALIKQGQELQKKGDYESARAVYQKLETIKGFTGVGQFYQATVAYDEHDTGSVTELADKAVHNLPNGTMKFQAMMLYGDGQLQQGHVDAAKLIFAGVAKQTTGDIQKQALRRLANVNKQLNKPEKDGL